MKFDTEKCLEQVNKILQQNGIRSEVHKFQSDCIMVDVWHKDYFYCLQLEPNLLGFSFLDDDDPGFSTVPNEKFYDLESFEKRLLQALQIETSASPTPAFA